MTLSFTRVTPEELDRAFEEPALAEEFVEDESRPYCFLEKSWAGIGFLLRADARARTGDTATRGRRDGMNTPTGTINDDYQEARG